MNRILDGDLLVPMTLSSDLRSVIMNVLTNDPDKRPSLYAIEGSEWMRRYKDEGIEIGQNVWDEWMKLSQ